MPQPRNTQFAEQLVEITPIRRDGDVSQRRTRLGERRALTGVVAAVEFAVSTLEVVLVEAPLMDDPPVIVDLDQMQMGRFIAGVVGPATPGKLRSLTPDGERVPHVSAQNLAEPCRRHGRGSTGNLAIRPASPVDVAILRNPGDKTGILTR